ncbi:ThuA domain-containing protein [uncultured Polaribacter sp.]|uniref:ThuA domain-containing protein n=1 Tax=uncultured Polaribacter sp. TaxID=174711 RepID=UPI00262867C4|nr:ThuA domain-containing protein [uncultured Polaribacter sp.]
MNSCSFKSFIITVVMLFCHIIIITSQVVKESTHLDTTISEKISVLIIDGFSNHNWVTNTKYLQKILESTGKFTVSVSTCPNQKENKTEWEHWNPDFNGYSVLIQTCNNVYKEDRLQWPNHVKQSFEKYVNKGGGVYIYHGATNAFKNWDAYNKMIALGWRDKEFGVAVTITNTEELGIISKGEGENTGHGPRRNALITQIGNHPIHEGIPKQWRAADVEVYRYTRGTTKNLEVLSYGKDEKTGLNFPTEWTVKFGKGKVYSSVYGHLWKNQEWPPSMRCAAFQQTMVRALQWLSGNEVDNYVEADFPNSKSTVLRLPIED